jgi:hypothetical protein
MPLGADAISVSVNSNSMIESGLGIGDLESGGLEDSCSESPITSMDSIHFVRSSSLLPTGDGREDPLVFGSRVPNMQRTPR